MYEWWLNLLALLSLVFLLFIAFWAFFEIFGNPATWRWLRRRCTLTRCWCRRKK